MEEGKQVYSLSAENLSKRFSKHLLFSSFSYRFAPGRLYVLLGSSGCGKSTLLHLLSGTEKPTSGKVVYEGSETPRKDISYLSQDVQIFYFLTAVENLEPVAGKDQERISGVLEEVGLLEKKDTLGKNLSKGEIARLALARMMLSGKRILVLDEPTGNLDPENAKKVFLLLKKMSRDHILILSSHDQTEAETFGDVLFTYQEGKILIQEKAGEAVSSEITEKPNKSHVPVKIYRKMLLEIGKRSLKPSLLFAPVFLFLCLFLFFSYSFRKSDLSSLVSSFLREANIQGVVSREYDPDGTYSAKGTTLSFAGEDESYLALSNCSNELLLPSLDLKCRLPDSLVLPSSIAKKESLLAGDLVSFSLNGVEKSGVVEKVYDYDPDSIRKEKLEKLSEEETGSLLSGNFPVFLSKDIFPEDSSFGYCSALYFTYGKSMDADPLLVSCLNQNTKVFWKDHKDYSRIYQYETYLAFFFLAIGLLLVLVHSFSSFSNETRLFQYRDGTPRSGQLLLSLHFLLYILALFLLSFFLFLTLYNVFQKFLVSYYMIQDIFPPLSFTASSFLIPLAFLLGMLLVLLSAGFLASNKAAKK